jgi:site-specific DNA recombinase
MKSNRCAAYARVSSDRQNPLSPTDQVRKCREFAESFALVVLEGHIYIDEDSGVGSDRPAFQRLLNAALSPERPFDTILADDTSRLSRSQSESLTVIEKLKFAGLRVIFESQGIDTDSEQSDVQMTVHGLVDSLYVKELAKKTHRGLESCALRGLHTGGRCYGYSAVAVGKGESKRLVIKETEAVVVKEIFELFAAGISLKKIAKSLNAKCVPSPRSRSTGRGTWCPTAIRAMLKRELYKGEIVWNRSKFLKVPGTNKRQSRPRPESERKRFSAPELTVVSQDLWNRVQSRFKSAGGLKGQRKPGLLPRFLTSPYLFSGLLKCGSCGSNLIITSGGGKKPKYVCSGYFNRGICSNKLYIRQDEVEERLLGKITGRTVAA